VLIGPAYLGTGYLSWVIAQLILGATNARLVGRLVFAVPILASFMMVAWDLSFDPIVSTIRQDWVWRDGGNYFGVPFSNFMGWWLTTYLFLQLFALYLRRRQQVYIAIAQPSRVHNLQAVIFYGLIAAGIVLNSLTQTTTATATDQVGVIWREQDIYVVSGLITIFTMGAFTALGLMKVYETPVQNVESHG
jgi:putative membrane protein